MHIYTTHRLYRRFLVVIFTTLFLGAGLALGVLAPSAAAQDQAVRESPPYDPAQVTVPISPPFAAVGRASYLENCAPCHGETGLADGPTAADLPARRPPLPTLPPCGNAAPPCFFTRQNLAGWKS